MDKKRFALNELCQRCGVHQLYLFGSGATDRFDPQKSDLDFLVSFVDRRPTGDYADRYLDFADGLENLFERPIDLVTEQSIHNPYFMREVVSTRTLLYEQPNAETTF